MNHDIRPLVWVQIAAGAVGAWWAGLDVAIRALLVMMALDYVSGLGAAYIKRDLASRVAREGLVKKLLQLLLVLAARVAGGSVPGLADSIGTAFALAFVAAELISIAENCGRAGVPMPSVVLNAIRTLKQAPESASLPLEHGRIRGGQIPPRPQTPPPPPPPPPKK